MQPGVAFGGLLVVAVVLRHVAARRFVQRHARYIWLMLLPQFVIAAAIVFVALELVDVSVGLAVAVGLAGAAYAGVVGELAWKSQHAMSGAPSANVGLDRTFELMGRAMLGMVGLALIGLIVAAALLVVMAVARPG
jgi:hypothetical protein